MNGSERIVEAAKQYKKTRFNGLVHHITTDLLTESFYCPERVAVPVVDKKTWHQYFANLENRPEPSQEHIHKKISRTRPSKRVYEPELKGFLDNRNRNNLPIQYLAGMPVNTCVANHAIKNILLLSLERSI